MATQSLRSKLVTVFVLPLGADTGGVNRQIVEAFKDQDGWLVRAMIGGTNYIGYPPDLPYDRDLLIDWWLSADIIHLSHDFYRLRKIERHRLPNKAKVIHYHGTGFREQPQLHIREQQAHRAYGLVSTLDLWLLAPEHTQWLPCPYDIEDLAQKRSVSLSSGLRRPGTVKVAHAPTNRKIKSTEALVAAVQRLQSEGHDVELDLIEKVPWSECLARKATVDIYYDQVTLGYGNNAIEAWGMGIPVIAGASKATTAEMLKRFDLQLPFLEATEATIYDALKALVLSPDLRAEYGERGYNHVRRFHDQKVVVEQLKDIYTRALARR